MKLDHVNSLLRLLAQAGPYLAIELVLPGGSVIALLTWLYRRKRKAASALRAHDVRLARRHDERYVQLKTGSRPSRGGSAFRRYQSCATRATPEGHLTAPHHRFIHDKCKLRGATQRARELCKIRFPPRPACAPRHF
jgi:hypothetical protein